MDEWGLSPREKEIAELIMRGLSSKEVAAKLCIAPRTEVRHRYNIYTKLGVSSNVQAVLRLLHLPIYDEENKT